MPNHPLLSLSSRRTALLGLAALLAAPFARAAAPAAEDGDLQRIATYLNGIRTMQSRFTQVAGDGSVAYGTIYLSRPGKMRIVYDPPAPILIVATDGQIYYYDSHLQQVSRTYTSDTPAYFLLRDPITLSGDVTVTDFAHEADAMRVTFVETKNHGLGQVTVVLTDNPLELRQWTVVDAQRKTVTVTLQNPTFNATLNPNLFYWTSPLPEGAGEMP